MQSVPRNVTDRFAHEFAVAKKGFSAKGITDYFSRFSTIVKPFDHYGIKPTRHNLFIESLYFLRNKEQYYALTELCITPPAMKYEVPSEVTRRDLMHSLHSYLSSDPIGLSFSSLQESKYRQDWYTAYSRLPSNPAAAITAARTMLETIFKTIISERGQRPDDSENLHALLKQTEDALGFIRPQRQPEHEIFKGMVSVINGIANISNSAGDRHGLVDGTEISDKRLAEFVLNACGTIGIAFIELHLFSE